MREGGNIDRAWRAWLLVWMFAKCVGVVACERARGMLLLSTLLSVALLS